MITLEQLKKSLSKKFSIYDKDICMGSGKLYIYKKCKKFPLFKIGNVVTIKKVGCCYIPDNEFRDIVGDITIYIVDTEIMPTDERYKVISKKDYIKNGNDPTTDVLFIGDKKVYIKQIDYFGLSTFDVDSIEYYFN